MPRPNLLAGLADRNRLLERWPARRRRGAWAAGLLQRLDALSLQVLLEVVGQNHVGRLDHHLKRCTLVPAEPVVQRFRNTEVGIARDVVERPGVRDNAQPFLVLADVVDHAGDHVSCVHHVVTASVLRNQLVVVDLPLERRLDHDLEQNRDEVRRLPEQALLALERHRDALLGHGD